MSKKIVPPFVRSAYNYDTEAASDESGLECKDVSLAKQAFAEECDINTIVRRFGLTGELPQGLRAPVYADFDDVVDYRTALHSVMAAEAAFMELPADVRARFQNDPQQFVAFCSDERNRAEAEKLGLIVPKATQEPLKEAPKGADKPA